MLVMDIACMYLPILDCAGLYWLLFACLVMVLVFISLYWLALACVDLCLLVMAFVCVDLCWLVWAYFGLNWLELACV